MRDPIWDHRDGTRWTPDLVHCRLLGVADTLQRLRGALFVATQTPTPWSVHSMQFGIGPIEAAKGHFDAARP